MLGTVLSIVIPVAVIAYGVLLAVRMILDRKKGSRCGGGCAGCPYAGGCDRCRETPAAPEVRDQKTEPLKEKPHD